MAERVTIDVGSSYRSGSDLITVQGTGDDDAGAYASVTVGQHPDITYARLRVNEPQKLPGGIGLHLAGIAPPGYAPAIALEITR